MSDCTRSVKAGPIQLTPNGRPAHVPNGTATAHMSSRLRKVVNLPSSVFTPIGSAATSDRVGWHVTVGKTNESAPTRRHSVAAARRRARGVPMSDANCGAPNAAAGEMMAPTVGSTSSGCTAIQAPTAA